MPVSRTKRTLQNSRMSLLLFLLQVFVGFYSRKVFLDCLGAEVIGLNTTIGNILSFLNLAELGIGIAMATSLYKPIHDSDQKTTCEILSVQGFLYKRIAMILCGLSIPVLLALPCIFPDTSFSIFYVYVVYFVFLSGSIFSYLWNYRQVLIQADQKNFKLMPWIHGVRYAKVFLQIVCLLLFGWGIWSWIAMEFAGNVATVFVINHVIRKEYPWLHTSGSSDKTLLEKYHHLIVKTKQLFVHKIGSFVLEQTAPLIIYYYVSLTVVTYYGNYMMLIGYVVTLLNVIFEGMGASIGNLISENDKKHTLEVFWELFTSRLWISATACFVLYITIAPFITLWIGEQYVLDDTTLILLVMSMFIRMTRSVIDSFKNAYQLFADVWSPVAEAIINLGCSILFGYWWWLNGVIMGSNLSLILIVLLWKPYYTFKYGLKASWLNYYLQYAFHLIILIGVAVLSIWCFMTTEYQTNDYLHLTFNLMVETMIYVVLTYILLYILTSGMKQFTNRIIHLKKRL